MFMRKLSTNKPLKNKAKKKQVKVICYGQDEKRGDGKNVTLKKQSHKRQEACGPQKQGKRSSGGQRKNPGRSPG
jgi:hypothetical protein